MYNQITQSNLTCQQEAKNYLPEIWNSFDPQPNEFGAGQLLAIKRKKSVLKVLNYFIVISKYFKHLYPSQSGDIEFKTGLENETINRAIKWLVQKGYLAKKGRGANKSCEYKVSSWFKNPWVQEQLKSILPVFYFTALALVSIQSLEKKQIKRSINDFNFILNTKQLRDVNTTTYEEEEYQRKILKKKGNEVNVALEKIKKELNLGEYETNQLSQFGEVVLREGWLVLNKQKEVKNKFRYLLGICRNLTERLGKHQRGGLNNSLKNKANQNLTNVSGSVNSDNVYLVKSYRGKTDQNIEISDNFSRNNEVRKFNNTQQKRIKKYTALQIANGISKFMDQQALNDFAKLMSKEVAEKYRNRLLLNWITNDYELSGETGEDVAVKCIEMYKEKLNSFFACDVQTNPNK